MTGISRRAGVLFGIVAVWVSWAAFGGRLLVPWRLVLASLRRRPGVCSVARRLATSQTVVP